MSVCIYAPSLASPLAGVLADRVRRRRLLLGLNTFSAVVLLALLAVRGRAGLWIIFVVMTWYGMELTISRPAENGLFVEMLPAELRRRLNDWNLGLQETGRLVAPLVGAGLFALVGGGSVALLDAGTFALAAVMIRRLRLDEARSSPGPPRWRSEVVAGFGPILETPELRRILLAGAVVIGISGVGVAAQYSLVQALGEPPSFLGVLNAALGAGSIVASLTSSRWSGASERWPAVLGTPTSLSGTCSGRAAGCRPPSSSGRSFSASAFRGSSSPLWTWRSAQPPSDCRAGSRPPSSSPCSGRRRRSRRSVRRPSPRRATRSCTWRRRLPRCSAVPGSHAVSCDVPGSSDELPRLVGVGKHKRAAGALGRQHPEQPHAPERPLAAPLLALVRPRSGDAARSSSWVARSVEARLGRRALSGWRARLGRAAGPPAVVVAHLPAGRRGPAGLTEDAAVGAGERQGAVRPEPATLDSVRAAHRLGHVVAAVVVDGHAP